MRESYNKPIVYAVKYSDEERKKSQSGGAFAVISDAVLDLGGVVYGCIFNEKFEAVHARAETKKERDAMRYSKYVQSNMLDVFSEVIKDLREGRKVLFSGTSCQVSGLLTLIDAKHKGLENELFTVDIVCHGVPSPLVWRDYLEWEQDRNGSRITDVLCRNKLKYGWKSHYVTMDFENGKELGSNVFPRIFYSHNILRPACYNCPYKDIIHPADITVADYWGIDNAAPGFKDDLGVSLVLINNDTGKDFFERCLGSVEYRKTRIENSMQRPLREPYKVPKKRTKFWSDYRTKDFTYIAYWYGEMGLPAKAKRILKTTAKKILKKK